MNNQKNNFEKFIHNYSYNFNKTFRKIDFKKIKKITLIIEKKISKNNHIFLAGNGGSAAVANHFVTDFNKGIKLSSKKKIVPKIISLSNSAEWITAIANDISFKEVFVHQLENYAKKGDCIIIFSCSGKSENIKKIINYANKRNLTCVFFTGFLFRDLSSKNIIHYDLGIKNYGISEDIFSCIMHIISQYIRNKYKNKNEIL